MGQQRTGSNRFRLLPVNRCSTERHGVYRYSASDEQFEGTLVATDGTEINAVPLGRIMSLVKNHLNLEQEHLWVVYPRIGQQDGKLHLQIGVWEPEKLRDLPATARPAPKTASRE